MLGTPLVAGVGPGTSGADFHEDTVARCPL